MILIHNIKSNIKIYTEIGLHDTNGKFYESEMTFITIIITIYYLLLYLLLFMTINFNIYY